MPARIQRKRVRGWRKPPGAVNVTRPGKWGNPYTIAEHGAGAVALYRLHLGRELAAGRLDLAELRGKDLMCWCSLGSWCHASVLLELANFGEPGQVPGELFRTEPHPGFWTFDHCPEDQGADEDCAGCTGFGVDCGAIWLRRSPR